MRELDFPAHTGPVRGTEVGEVCIEAGSRVDECATHDLVVLHAPLDLTALIVRRFRLAVWNRSRAGIPWQAPTYAGQTAMVRVPSPAAARLMSARRPA